MALVLFQFQIERIYKNKQASFINIIRIISAAMNIKRIVSIYARLIITPPRITNLFFCTRKDTPSADNTPNKTLKKPNLSEDLQRALWARYFIDTIKNSKPLSLQEVEETSLHQKLLSIEKPFPEKFADYEFSQKIKKEMQAFFLINVGVPIDIEIFPQDRFQKALNKQGRITFYPNYNTTSHIFKRMYDSNRSVLIYGRWGTGKSLSIILCIMLTRIVTSYIRNNPQQAQQYKDLFSVFEIVYWSINKNDTEISFLRNILKQRQHLWSYKKLRKTFHNFQEFFEKLSQKQKQLLKKKICQFSIAYQRIVIDQINVLASLKRKYKAYKYFQKRKQSDAEMNTISEQITTLDMLKDNIEKGQVVIIYNSSSNIESDLIEYNSSSNKKQALTLGKGRVEVRTQKFDYQDFETTEDFKQKLRVIQLSQHFINIIQQKINLSSVGEKKNQFLQAQNQFKIYDWLILPNMVTINEGVENSVNESDKSKEVWQKANIHKILKSIKTSTEKQLKILLKNFVKKQKERFLNNQKQTQNLFTKAFQCAQAEVEKQKENPNPNENSQQRKFSFLVKITTSQLEKSYLQNQEYEKQIFSYIGEDEQRNHVFKCMVSPNYFMKAFFLQMLFYLPKYLIKIYDNQQFLNMEKTKESDYHTFLGTLFECTLMRLLYSNNINLKIDGFSLLIQFQKVVFIQIIKSQDSLKSQTQYLKDLDSCILCIPNQFKIIQQENFLQDLIAQLPKKEPTSPKSGPNQMAFDFLIISRVKTLQKKKFYYLFFDMTISKRSIAAKCENFVNRLLQLKQFSSFKLNRKLSQKNLLQFKGFINFFVIRLSGQNEIYTPDFPIGSVQRDFADQLDITFTICNYSKIVRNKKQFKQGEETAQNKSMLIISTLEKIVNNSGDGQKVNKSK